MDNTLATITPIKPAHFVTATAAIETHNENTSDRPVLWLCDDNKTYWCKSIEGCHASAETLVNELITYEVGKLIGAPVPEWRIVITPEELLDAKISKTARPSRYPMFGSRQVNAVQEKFDEMGDVLDHIERDSNHTRVPHLVALWLLCNAADMQVGYDLTDDFTIWSFDHGAWLGSDSWNRKLEMPNTAAGRPQISRIPRGTSSDAWLDARNSLTSLTIDKLAYIHSLIPPEWNVTYNEIQDILVHIVQRSQNNWVLDQMDQAIKMAAEGKK